mgnify:CR=1 FL=1
MERYAVIDLGTNTFHLKIVALHPDGTFEECFRERQFVKLGEEGIDTLGPAAYQRGIETIVYFHQLLQEYQVKKLRATGTAALRTASNGGHFIEEVFQKTGIKIELITGKEEARLIYEGVRLAVPLHASPDLIMDIGGGSVEFILATENGLMHTWSYPVGMSVLYLQFHQDDPLLPAKAHHARQFLDGIFAKMFAQLKPYPIQRLIGASGAFEVLANMLPSTLVDERHFRVSSADLRQLIPTLLFTTKAERIEMANLPSERADMIVVAFLLIEHLLINIPFREVLVSEYALREGVLGEMAFR